MLKWSLYSVQYSQQVGDTSKKWNESGFRPLLCTYRLNWTRITSWGWWDEWDDTVEIRALAVFGRARDLSVTEVPHNTEVYEWMEKKHFGFFQTAETGKRTPNSGVKGSGANHYPWVFAGRTPLFGCSQLRGYARSTIGVQSLPRVRFGSFYESTLSGRLTWHVCVIFWSVTGDRSRFLSASSSRIGVTAGDCGKLPVETAKLRVFAPGDNQPMKSDRHSADAAAKRR